MNNIMITVILTICIFTLFSCENIRKNGLSEKEKIAKKNGFVSQLNNLRDKGEDTERKNTLRFDTLKNVDPKTVHIVKIAGKQELNGFLELCPTFPFLEKLEINVEMTDHLFNALMSRLEGKQYFKKLMINRCDLKKIPSTIAKLQSLEVLYSFENPLMELPPEIGLMKNLRKIDFISATELKIIPAEIGQLEKLEILLVLGSKVETLPAEIGKCQNLWRLSIDDAQLKNLPPEIGLCTKLRYLNISSNEIKSLPSEIGNLIELSGLNLEFNQLNELPTSVKELKKLFSLGLSGNEFSTFPEEVLSLDGLVSLSIDQNKFKKFPVEIGGLKSLKFLNVDQDFINKGDLGELKAKNSKLSIRGIY